MATALLLFGAMVLLHFIRKFLNEFIPRIFLGKTAQELKLTQDISEMKKQQHFIDAQNEFAKFAKLQRQINKQENLLTRTSNERRLQGVKTRWVLWFIGVVISVVCHVAIFVFYRHIPVVVLPISWLYPLAPILKFPTNVEGAIGLPCWMFISRSVINVLESL